ncbi:MAG TPA: helix-turn-helix domain-containing protein [Acidimicrobiales bacterium]|nr:helix-turn-helix domain-containing protein [Acidimicrobiales bacterium]
MVNTDPLPHLLTIDQVADQLGITIRHVRRLVAERRVPFLKVGGLVRFDPTDIAAWLDDARHPRSDARTLTQPDQEPKRCSSRIR